MEPSAHGEPQKRRHAETRGVERGHGSGLSGTDEDNGEKHRKRSSVRAEGRTGDEEHAFAAGDYVEVREPGGNRWHAGEVTAQREGSLVVALEGSETEIVVAGADVRRKSRQPARGTPARSVGSNSEAEELLSARSGSSYSDSGDSGDDSSRGGEDSAGGTRGRSRGRTASDGRSGPEPRARSRSRERKDKKKSARVFDPRRRRKSRQVTPSSSDAEGGEETPPTLPTASQQTAAAMEVTCDQDAHAVANGTPTVSAQVGAPAGEGAPARAGADEGDKYKRTWDAGPVVTGGGAEVPRLRKLTVEDIRNAKGGDFMVYDYRDPASGGGDEAAWLKPQAVQLCVGHGLHLPHVGSTVRIIGLDRKMDGKPGEFGHSSPFRDREAGLNDGRQTVWTRLAIPISRSSPALRTTPEQREADARVYQAKLSPREVQPKPSASPPPAPNGGEPSPERGGPDGAGSRMRADADAGPPSHVDGKGVGAVHAQAVPTTAAECIQAVPYGADSDGTASTSKYVSGVSSLMRAAGAALTQQKAALKQSTPNSSGHPHGGRGGTDPGKPPTGSSGQQKHAGAAAPGAGGAALGAATDGAPNTDDDAAAALLSISSKQDYSQMDMADWPHAQRAPLDPGSISWNEVREGCDFVLAHPSELLNVPQESQNVWLEMDGTVRVVTDSFDAVAREREGMKTGRPVYIKFPKEVTNKQLHLFVTMLNGGRSIDLKNKRRKQSAKSSYVKVVFKREDGPGGVGRAPPPLHAALKAGKADIGDFKLGATVEWSTTIGDEPQGYDDGTVIVIQPVADADDYPQVPGVVFAATLVLSRIMDRVAEAEGMEAMRVLYTQLCDVGLEFVSHEFAPWTIVRTRRELPKGVASIMKKLRSACGDLQFVHLAASSLTPAKDNEEVVGSKVAVVDMDPSVHVIWEDRDAYESVVRELVYNGDVARVSFRGFRKSQETGRLARNHYKTANGAAIRADVFNVCAMAGAVVLDVDIDRGRQLKGQGEPNAVHVTTTPKGADNLARRKSVVGISICGQSMDLIRGEPNSHTDRKECSRRLAEAAYDAGNCALLSTGTRISNDLRVEIHRRMAQGNGSGRAYPGRRHMACYKCLQIGHAQANCMFCDKCHGLKPHKTQSEKDACATKHAELQRTGAYWVQRGGPAPRDRRDQAAYRAARSQLSSRAPLPLQRPQAPRAQPQLSYRHALRAPHSGAGSQQQRPSTQLAKRPPPSALQVAHVDNSPPAISREAYVELASRMVPHDPEAQALIVQTFSISADAYEQSKLNAASIGELKTESKAHQEQSKANHSEVMKALSALSMASSGGKGPTQPQRQVTRGPTDGLRPTSLLQQVKQRGHQPSLQTHVATPPALVPVQVLANATGGARRGAAGSQSQHDQDAAAEGSSDKAEGAKPAAEQNAVVPGEMMRVDGERVPIHPFLGAFALRGTRAARYGWVQGHPRSYVVPVTARLAWVIAGFIIFDGIPLSEHTHPVPSMKMRLAALLSADALEDIPKIEASWDEDQERIVVDGLTETVSYLFRSTGAVSVEKERHMACVLSLRLLARNVRATVSPTFVALCEQLDSLHNLVSEASMRYDRRVRADVDRTLLAEVPGPQPNEVVVPFLADAGGLDQNDKYNVLNKVPTEANGGRTMVILGSSPKKTILWAWDACVSLAKLKRVKRGKFRSANVFGTAQPRSVNAAYTAPRRVQPRIARTAQRPALRWGFTATGPSSAAARPPPRRGW